MTEIPPKKSVGSCAYQTQCNICGWHGQFLFPEKGREGMLCRNCNSTSRHRAVVYAMGRLLNQGYQPLFQWPKNTSLKVLESSARGFYPTLLSEKYNYYFTEFDSEKIAEGKKPKEYADFQDLHYHDDEFDLVIASDVFEHIRRDTDGFKEVYRVLKPSGSLILTIPYDHNRQKTILRVDTTTDEDVYLMEPIYHGGGGHTLMYRNYGRDLLSSLRAIGFTVLYVDIEVPVNGITKQSVIACSKMDHVAWFDRPLCVTSQRRPGLLLMPYRILRLLRLNFMGFKNIWKNHKKN